MFCFIEKQPTALATHEVHGRNGNKYLVVVLKYLELNLAYFPNSLLLQPLAVIYRQDMSYCDHQFIRTQRGVWRSTTA